MAQKKVDILQKALKHHPGSQEVVLRLITASQVFQEEDEVHRRWQVKVHHPPFCHKIAWKDSEIVVAIKICYRRTRAMDYFMASGGVGWHTPTQFLEVQGKEGELGGGYLYGDYVPASATLSLKSLVMQSCCCAKKCICYRRRRWLLLPTLV